MSVLADVSQSNKGVKRMKATRIGLLVVLLLLAAAALAGPASGQTADVDVTGDTEGNSSVADAEAGASSGNTGASLSTGSGSGETATADATGDDAGGSAGLGCVDGAASGGSGAATSVSLGFCGAGSPGGGAAILGGDSGGSGGTGALGCLSAEGSRGETGGGAIIGSCTARGTAANAGTASGDTAGGGTVGCVSADARHDEVGARVAVLPEPPPETRRAVCSPWSRAAGFPIPAYPSGRWLSSASASWG